MDDDGFSAKISEACAASIGRDICLARRLGGHRKKTRVYAYTRREMADKGQTLEQSTR